jgi:putative transcriptional regulator
MAMVLHNRLKEIRLQRDFTQEALANAVGVTRQTIIAIEKEKFVPSVKLALELGRALGTALEELFWLENNQKLEDNQGRIK